MKDGCTHDSAFAVHLCAREEYIAALIAPSGRECSLQWDIEDRHWHAPSESNVDLRANVTHLPRYPQRSVIDCYCILARQNCRPFIQVSFIHSYSLFNRINFWFIWNKCIMNTFINRQMINFKIIWNADLLGLEFVTGHYVSVGFRALSGLLIFCCFSNLSFLPLHSVLWFSQVSMFLSISCYRVHRRCSSAHISTHCSLCSQVCLSFEGISSCRWRNKIWLLKVMFS